MALSDQPEPSHRRRNAAIVFVVVVLLLVVVGLPLLMRSNNVVITSDDKSVHLDLSVCSASNLCQTRTFSLVNTNSSTLTTGQGDTFLDHTRLPFSRLANLTSTCNSFTVTITEDSLETPGFTVQSQSPSLPITFQNAATNITITSVVVAPDYSYTGGLEWLVSGTVSCTVAVPSTTVYVTGDNLAVDYTGTTSGYFGPTFQALGNPVSVSGGGELTVTLTLRNGDYYQAHWISSISLTTTGFTLLSISTSLPYALPSGSSLEITLTIQAPNMNYNGPVGILLSTY